MKAAYPTLTRRVLGQTNLARLCNDFNGAQGRNRTTDTAIFSHVAPDLLLNLSRLAVLTTLPKSHLTARSIRRARFFNLVTL
jgi:hypothetical protein